MKHAMATRRETHHLWNWIRHFSKIPCLLSIQSFACQGISSLVLLCLRHLLAIFLCQKSLFVLCTFALKRPLRMAGVAQFQLDEDTPYSSSPPSSPESSSDKENPRRRVSKRPSFQMPSRNDASKRRRLTDRASNIQSHPSSQQKARLFYDPDQPEEERRRVRKTYRDLTTDFNGKILKICSSGF